MKILTVILLLAGAVLGYVAWRAPEASYVAPEAEAAPKALPVLLPPAVPDDCELVVLEVTGMCCEGCSGKLFAALSAAEGVRDAAVDFQSGTASAHVTRGTDPAELERLLTFGDYAAVARR